MDNESISEERMRNIFIQAAKELLKGEGLKSINARNIADKAGYSYSTFKNYFKDLKDLVFECIKGFQDECEEYVSSETKKVPRGIEKIKAISKAYAKYLIEYPSVFELFYIEKMSDIEGKHLVSDRICNFSDTLCAEEWKYCVKEELVSPGQANSMRSILKYQIPGLLLIYLNRRNPIEYSEFITILDRQFDKILLTESILKKGRIFEIDSTDFIMENEGNLFCFIHYTKDENVANQILTEGFKYVESFHHTALEIFNDKSDMNYKHSMYKYYGKYILVINISKKIYNFYSDCLKKDGKIKYHIENILSEQPPTLNENGEMVYILPPQFVKGYINHENGEIVLNPKFNPNYNPKIFAENLKKNK
jgi:AcrR family transcriptional regulator